MKEILYFSAPWCGPCKSLKPMFEQAIKDYPTISVDYIDVDQSREKCTANRITSVPTLVFKDGSNEVNRLIGVKSVSALRQAIESLLGSTFSPTHKSL